MLRISGGTFRSRLLKTPDTTLTKPTMDKVRNGVFSALQNDIKGKKVLDLFAGSGSYGFESLSRGALSITFIDNGLEAIKVIKENARALDVLDQTKIYKEDSFSFLVNRDEEYDIIFVDPPYKKYDYKEIVEAIINSSSLAKNGILVLESDYNLDIDLSLFSKSKEYKYSQTYVYILRR